MMQPFPDPQEHFKQYLEQANARYADSIQRSGLVPTEKLLKALAERAVEDAMADYQMKADEALYHNIELLRQSSKKHDQDIKREEAKKGLFIWLPFLMVFGFDTWLNFIDHNLVMEIICLCGSLIFLILFVSALVVRQRTKRLSEQLNPDQRNRLS